MRLPPTINTSTYKKPPPPQRLPGWIRWPLRALLLPWITFDMLITNAITRLFKPPLKRKGSCKRCGRCCRYILIMAPDSFFSRLYLLWNTEINGFFPRSNVPILVDDEHMLVMGCRYAQPNGSCKHHFLRPAICRKWPIIEYFGLPRILEGCAYEIVPRQAEEPNDESLV